MWVSLEKYPTLAVLRQQLQKTLKLPEDQSYKKLSTIELNLNKLDCLSLVCNFSQDYYLQLSWLEKLTVPLF